MRASAMNVSELARMAGSYSAPSDLCRPSPCPENDSLDAPRLFAARDMKLVSVHYTGSTKR
jgi:hypothetical protein